MMTQYFPSPSTESIDETLQELYQHRSIIQSLIHSLEEYDRASQETPSKPVKSIVPDNRHVRRLAS